MGGVEVCVARGGGVAAAACAITFVTEGDCGGGCGEDGGVEGGEAGVVAVGVVGGVDDAVAEEVVLGGEGAGEGKCGDGGGDVEA